jgi:hypothetical protein
MKATMNRSDMKKELSDAVVAAVRAYLDTMRGAEAFGTLTEVKRPTGMVTQVHSTTVEHGNRTFEISVKEVPL